MTTDKMEVLFYMFVFLAVTDSAEPTGLKIFGGYTRNYDGASNASSGDRLSWGDNETSRNRNNIFFGHGYCRNPFIPVDQGYCYQRLIINTGDDYDFTFLQVVGSYQVIEEGGQENITHRVGIQVATPPLQNMVVLDGETGNAETNEWGYGRLHFIVNATSTVMGQSSTDTLSSQNHYSRNRQMTLPEEWHYREPLPSSVRVKVAEFRCWTAEWGSNSVKAMYMWRINDISVEASTADSGMGHRSVTPSEPRGATVWYQPRLVGGDAAYEGRLEAYDADRWVRPCAYRFNGPEALAICKHLGYDGYSSINPDDGSGATAEGGPAPLSGLYLQCGAGADYLFSCEVYALPEGQDCAGVGISCEGRSELSTGFIAGIAVVVLILIVVVVSLAALLIKKVRSTASPAPTHTYTECCDPPVPTTELRSGGSATPVPGAEITLPGRSEYSARIHNENDRPGSVQPDVIYE